MFILGNTAIQPSSVWLGIFRYYFMSPKKFYFIHTGHTHFLLNFSNHFMSFTIIVSGIIFPFHFVTNYCLPKKSILTFVDILAIRWLYCPFLSILILREKLVLKYPLKNKNYHTSFHSKEKESSYLYLFGDL